MKAWMRAIGFGAWGLWAASAAHAQTIYAWYGSNSTDWADTANWSLPNGAAPAGGTANARLQVQTIAGGYDLVYGDAQGTTLYNTSGSGTPRSFLIYPTSTFRIEGGIFETQGTSADLIGVNAGFSQMIINGGAYIRTNDIAGSELLFGFNANSTGVLHVVNGLADIRGISLGANNATAYGEIWVSGGTLTAGAIVKSTGNGMVFLDGGVFKASQDNLDWIGSGLPVRITGNGALVDTAGFNVGLQRYLLNSNGNGGLIVYGGGSLALYAGANNTYAGNTVVSNATLRLGAQSSVPNGTGRGDLYLLEGATFDLGGFSDSINGLNGDGVVDNTLDVGSYLLNLCDGNASGVFNGRIRNTSGTLNITKVGTGTQTLGGSNSYDGVTTVSAGTLLITDGHALGSTVGGTVVANGQRLTLSGAITVDGEAVTISGTGGDSFGALRATGGVSTWTGPVTLGADMTRIGAIGGGLTISGAIGDGGAGYGLRIRNPNGDFSVIELGAENTYGGRTEIWQGVARLAGGHDRLPTVSSALLGFQDGVGNMLVGHLDLNGWNQRVTGLELNANITDPLHALRQAVTNSAVGTTSVLTVSNETDFAFGGVIAEGAGSIALVKKGAGTLALNGANTYAGDTTIEAGTLAINGTHTGGGLITVQAGGMLSGTGAVAGAVTVNTGGRIGPGNSAGTLTLWGNLNLSAVGAANAGDVVLELGIAAQDLILLTSGMLDIGAGTLGFSDFTFVDLGDLAPGTYTLVSTPSAVSGSLDASDLSGPVGAYSGTLEVGDSGTDLTLTVVPEPATAGLAALAVLLCALRRRKR